MPSFPTRSGARAAGLGPPDEVLPRAPRASSRSCTPSARRVSVGETYFFRHPEHFRWMAATSFPSC